MQEVYGGTKGHVGGMREAGRQRKAREAREKVRGKREERRGEESEPRLADAFKGSTHLSTAEMSIWRQLMT